MMNDSADFETRLHACAARGAAGVPELVDLVLREGVGRGASDVHLEPAAAGALLLRYRLDGVLSPAVSVAIDCPGNVIARIKVLADLLTYQTDVPQEGRINRARLDTPGDLRVSTFPTIFGEKAVVRIFDPATQDARLDALGYPDDARAALERQLRMPGGLLLLTGPAASGKTTTIYAALRYILDVTAGERNIVSVEDPVERVIAGISQTQVRPAAGLTFARCLRSLMRQDPEVIVIGEIRDRETADIAVEAGLTGHLVISTIHSGAATGVFTRLLDMGVAPWLVASSVGFAAAQRLLRRLCPRCRRAVGDDAWEAAGCDECFHTGYRGRAVIVEALTPDDALRRLVAAGAPNEDLQRVAVAGGMTPLRAAAAAAVRAGVTSPAEVERVLGPE